MAEESYLQPTEPVQPTDAPAQPKFALSAALSSQLEMADTASAKVPSLGAPPEPEQETVAPKTPAALALGHATPRADLTPGPVIDRGSLITVVSDPEHKLGKRFGIKSDGSIDKQSRVNVTRGIAVMYIVDTPEAMSALLEAVGKDSHAAIVNSSFDGIEPGEEFLIGSAREIEKLTGIPRGDRARQQGVHRIQIGDKHYKMVGRFKENVRPSRWQLLDRDIDVHTPAPFAAMSLEQWVQSFFGLVPGVADLTYCHAPSTSSRVLRDGVPVGGGNGHVWLQVKDPSDIERARTAILISAADLGLTWLKPRYSRTEPGKVIGHSLATIIDTSVWTPGRLVFVGEPVAGEGLSVAPLTVTIHRSAGAQRLDTSMLVLPDASQIRKITRKAGVAMEVQQGATGLRITASDLTLDTEIETVDGGIKSVRELVQQGVTGKLRCQTPFRDSSSFAAFYSTNDAGKPFVYDSGTSTTHWLADTEAKGLQLAVATGVVTRMMPKVPADCGAPFEPDAIAALATVQSQDLAEYRRIRADLRKASKDVSVPAVEQAIKEHLEELGQVQTHHGYAVDIIRRLTVDDFAPVGYEGVLYVADPDTGLWVKYPRDALARLVAI